DVPSTVVGTSGASTQSSNVTEIAENVLSLQKERSISSGKVNLLQYGDSEPTRILFQGENVHDLIRAVKKKLSPDFDDVSLDCITIRRHGEEIGLCPGLVVDRSFINDYETPLQII
ncbi:9716_t:CDS:2, partial [Gigaspora margarita]